MPDDGASDPLAGFSDRTRGLVQSYGTVGETTLSIALGDGFHVIDH